MGQSSAAPTLAHTRHTLSPPGDPGLKTAPLPLPCFSLLTEQPWSCDLWDCKKSTLSLEGPSTAQSVRSPHSAEQGGFPSSLRTLLLSPELWKRSNTAAGSSTASSKQSLEGDASSSSCLAAGAAPLQWDKHLAKPRAVALLQENWVPRGMGKAFP